MPKQHDFNGRPGCVMQSKNQETGTWVGLYHAEQAGLDTTHGPWAVVCEYHGQSCNYRTRKLATIKMAHPLGWCEVCRYSLDARSGDLFPFESDTEVAYAFI